MTFEELLSNGPIVMTVKDQMVKIGIDTLDERLRVRDELLV